MSLQTTSRAVRQGSTRRYFTRLGIRVGLLTAVVLFLSKDFVQYALAAAAAGVVLYLLSYLLRRRNSAVADFLMTLGDFPALAAAVHLPPHELGLEAVLPVWLIGVTVANLRTGAPLLLPLYGVGAWLIVLSHAPSTQMPITYVITQTLVVGFGCAVAFTMMREHHSHSTDDLTGVPTRRAGLEALSHFVSHQERVTLAFIDLRGFKRINDTYGHTVGDEVLGAVARRLRRLVRGSDVLFRYGGDEFLVASTLSELEPRLRQAFASPVVTSRGTLNISARIGVMSAASTTDLDDILHEADRRMYADTRTDPGVVSDGGKGKGEKRVDTFTVVR